MAISLLYVSCILIGLSYGAGFNWKAYADEMNNHFTFKMLHHSKEIAGETKAYENTGSNKRFAKYWVDESRTQERTAYIFGGVGSTTTQFLSVKNENLDKNSKDDIKPVENTGKNFGGKSDMTDGELLTAAGILLRQLVDKRKTIFNTFVATDEIKDCSVIFDKTMSFGLYNIRNPIDFSPYPNGYVRCPSDFKRQLDDDGKKFKLFPVLGRDISDENVAINNFKDGESDRNIRPAKAIQQLRKAANMLNRGVYTNKTEMPPEEKLKYGGQYRNFYIKPPCGPSIDMGFADDMARKLTIAVPGPIKGIGDIGGGDGRAVFVPKVTDAKEEKTKSGLTANQLYEIACKAETLTVTKMTTDNPVGKEGMDYWEDTGKLMISKKNCEDDKVKSYFTELVSVGKNAVKIATALGKLLAKHVTDAADKLGITATGGKYPIEVYQTGVMRAAYFDATNDKGLNNQGYAHEEPYENMLTDVGESLFYMKPHSNAYSSAAQSVYNNNNMHQHSHHRMKRLVNGQRQRRRYNY